MTVCRQLQGVQLIHLLVGFTPGEDGRGKSGSRARGGGAEDFHGPKRTS